MTDDSTRLAPSDVGDPTDRLALGGDRVLVTGAANGIGRVTTFALAASGADLLVTDRLADDLDAVVAELRAAYDVDVASATADLTDPEAVEELADTAAAGGGVDVLANVAGASRPTRSLDIDHEEWDLVQSVNLRAPFLTATALHPELAGGGAIVNVASVAGIYGATSMAHYAAAKSGLRTLTRTLAHEWAEDDVRVNAVAPGRTFTEGASQSIETSPEVAFDRDRVARSAISPAEVADAIAFLASPAASGVTGRTLVAGGPPPTLEDF